MIRWLMILLVGLVLGAIVHLSTIILLPLTATRDQPFSMLSKRCSE